MSRYGEAQRLSKSGDYSRALQIFAELHRQYADPKLLYPIAFMYYKLGRNADAVTAFEDYLASGVETDAARLALVQEQLKRAKELAGPSPVAASSQPSAVVSSQPPVVASSNPPVASAHETTAQSLPYAKPLYKKPWFWAVVGGSVAAIGLGVGLGIGFSSRTPSLPEGVNTYVPTF